MGLPEHPSQRLMYKTHENKNTELIKMQYISIKNRLKISVPKRVKAYACKLAFISSTCSNCLLPIRRDKYSAKNCLKCK